MLRNRKLTLTSTLSTKCTQNVTQRRRLSTISNCSIPQISPSTQRKYSRSPLPASIKLRPKTNSSFHQSLPSATPISRSSLALVPPHKPTTQRKNTKAIKDIYRGRGGKEGRGEVVQEDKFKGGDKEKVKGDQGRSFGVWFSLGRKESKSKNGDSQSPTKDKISKAQKRQSRQSQNSPDKQVSSLKPYLSQSNLYKRLAIYSSETIKQNLRIYREDLQKIIAQRYGKDRICQFLDMEYIEDYNSMLERMNDLLQFTKQQIQILVFSIMDCNRDGLITADDLLTLVGAKKQNVKSNSLVVEDVNLVIAYLNKMHKEGRNVVNQISQDYLFLKQQGLTLIKYRTLRYQRSRQHNNLLSGAPKTKMISSRMRDHLFTLGSAHTERREGERTAFQYNAYGHEQKGIQFSVNFEIFKEIFKERMPKTFIDVLYLIGGLEVPNVTYDQIDDSVLKKKQQDQVSFFQKASVQKIKSVIRELKQFNRITPTFLRYKVK